MARLTQEKEEQGPGKQKADSNPALSDQDQSKVEELATQLREERQAHENEILALQVRSPTWIFERVGNVPVLKLISLLGSFCGPAEQCSSSRLHARVVVHDGDAGEFSFSKGGGGGGGKNVPPSAPGPGGKRATSERGGKNGPSWEEAKILQ